MEKSKRDVSPGLAEFRGLFEVARRFVVVLWHAIAQLMVDAQPCDRSGVVLRGGALKPWESAAAVLGDADSPRMDTAENVLRVDVARLGERLEPLDRRFGIAAFEECECGVDLRAPGRHELIRL